jgi:hypothetical protein
MHCFKIDAFNDNVEYKKELNKRIKRGAASNPKGGETNGYYETPPHSAI